MREVIERHPRPLAEVNLVERGSDLDIESQVLRDGFGRLARSIKRRAVYFRDQLGLKATRQPLRLCAPLGVQETRLTPGDRMSQEVGRAVTNKETRKSPRHPSRPSLVTDEVQRPQPRFVIRKLLRGDFMK